MGGQRSDHGELLAEMSRRGFLARAGALGLGTMIASAAPLAASARAEPAPGFPDATLQAFADTVIPGRKATTTDLGHAIHPQAIAGVDPLPGAVEADALALYHHPQIGFDALEAPFLADLEALALTAGNSFLGLDFDGRTGVCKAGLDFSNPLRVLWEAAAAIPFTAFCAAALITDPQTSEKASGYRVMGLPGAAPNGYPDASFRRAFARERTRTGSLR